nr:NAD(P)H-dependent oxidoreductase [uncultured Devosia sp.]
MPKCLVLSGHPLTPSFSAALADSYAEMMSSAGVTVRRVDLAGMDVPASIPNRLPGDDEMRGDIAAFWDDMVWADHVVIVHPLWWGGMPAKLKALFDIVLQMGRAYRYDGATPLPLGLLKGRSARVIVTSDTPAWFMALIYGNAHFRIIKNQILRFVGFGPIRTTHLSMIRHSTPEQRANMLEKVVAAARKDAERLNRLTTKMAA